MRHIQPSLPLDTSFRWRVTPEGNAEFSYIEDVWWDAGNLTDEDGPLKHVFDKSFNQNDLLWKTPLSSSLQFVHNAEWDKKTKSFIDAWVMTSDYSKDTITRIKELNEAKELRLLSLVAEATNMKLCAEGWRMLSPNGVLHFQFGPGVTVCTDGPRVILFSRPRWGTEWMIVARQNIVGPVTSSPIHTADWDYVNNKPLTSQTGEAKPSRQVKLSTVAKVEALLNKLIAEHVK